MKRGYHRSRSNSQERRKYYRDRSGSRSRQKQNKKQAPNNSSRDNNYRVGLAKTQSDIRNHFRFRLPNLTTKEQQDTIAMLKSKLNQHIGPVQHITRSRETMALNLGFKYDIDAMSFLQTGGLTVKTAAHKIHLEPAPTKAFQYIIKQKRQQTNGDKNDKNVYQKRHSKGNRQKSRSYSSSSSSNKRSNRSESKSNQKYIKLQIYGIPAFTSFEKAVSILNHAPGGPYKFGKTTLKRIKDSVCQYLQVKMEPQKADRLLQQSNKIQVDGKPVIIIEESQRPGKQLLSYQVQIQFPKAVHPSKVLKSLQPHAKVVQIVANQQLQQDGKCRSYIITLNDHTVVNQLKKMGDLNCGIWVGEPKAGHLVYRPIQLLPSRHQL